MRTALYVVLGLLAAGGVGAAAWMALRPQPALPPAPVQQQPQPGVQGGPGAYGGLPAQTKQAAPAGQDPGVAIAVAAIGALPDLINSVAGLF